MALAKRLVVVVLLEMDAFFINMVNAMEYRNVKLVVSISLAPHQRFVEGGGLFLKHGNDISNGAGLLMGAKSPFKNIPFWDCYCNYIL